MTTSLFNESKALLSNQSPELAAFYEKDFLSNRRDTPRQVTDYWCDKIYTLESETQESNLLHHRLYLKEAVNDLYYWLKYFREQVVPLFLNNQRLLINR